MNRQRALGLLVIIAFTLFLSGCTGTDYVLDRENGNFWEKYVVAPVSDALDWFAELLWGQYGLSILVVTIIIRFLILPLTLKQIRSSKEMQKIQPEIKKITEKYKSNPQKQQEEMMRLFQKHNINPFSGCLPILIQMPILIALYNAIMWNPEIREHNFLWIQLGEPDKFILPAIAALTTYIQQQMMSSQLTPQMRTMMIIFPILIFVMSMSFPAALPLYWIYSNLFTIVQNYFIYGRKDESAEAKGGQKK